jgi:hypothetical protein
MTRAWSLKDEDGFCGAWWGRVERAGATSLRVSRCELAQEVAFASR